MATSYEAKCECGYKSSGLIGGLRSTYMQKSQFPFYCEKDGMVSVNFREEPISCPWCKSTNIKQYGLPPISLPPTGRKWPAIQAWNYEAYSDGNLCPQCKKMTLKFGRDSLGLCLD